MVFKRTKTSMFGSGSDYICLSKTVTKRAEGKENEESEREIEKRERRETDKDTKEK